MPTKAPEPIQTAVLETLARYTNWLYKREELRAKSKAVFRQGSTAVPGRKNAVVKV